MSVRLRVTVLAAVTFALVTACGTGGSGGNKVASLSSSESAKPSEEQQANDNRSDEDKIRDFTKCMKEHGVDIPEPTSAPKAGGGGGDGKGSPGIVIQGAGPEKEKIDKANEACRKLLPNGGQPPKLDAKQLDEMRKMAQCMREHGVNMPDPDPDHPGIMVDPNSGDKPDPEAMNKAAQACGGNGKQFHVETNGNGGGGAASGGSTSGGGK